MSVQKCIIGFVNIGKFIFFSNVVKCVRPTYGNKEAPASLIYSVRDRIGIYSQISIIPKEPPVSDNGKIINTH